MVEVAREAKNIGAGAGGAFFGVVTTEFPSEVIARSTGLNGGAKVGVKSVVKIVIGLVFISIARRLPGLWSVFMAVAGWTGIGSIGLDIIAWVKPGGIYRLAEETAVAIRRATLGAAAVAKELKELEVKAEEAATTAEVKPVEQEVVVPARRWIG